jgi:hypothetical protein
MRNGHATRLAPGLVASLILLCAAATVAQTPPQPTYSRKK